ncbi:cobalamin biosynthesis protein CbiX [Paracoccus aurantiacus]|uniref:Cobalamin biosynthesis protein CbiX n=1 Tax=Paracoccus aurantiacus TaxID=2599412 RepID=A0A5C6RWA9_9RHOB|nr:CbiX/SirB N-terminal domain-containing protein [Paracoccus aurantiacus]TXB66387.1 cobalamin biosynthesis protein CbiX [Paracoccus aurantiacus]
MTRPVIIIAHGQPSDPGPQQAAIEDLAAAVSQLAARPVLGATLADADALARAVADAPRALIYPMFMAAGWFTGKELPRRLAALGAADPYLHAPFGLDPTLAELCLTKLRDAACDAGLSLNDVTLLLIAHGSKRARGSANGAEAMAELLRLRLGRVVTGFIEEAPFLRDAARDLGPNAIALPFFATRAEHVTDDIPQALAEAGFEGRLLDPIGLAPEVPALIAAALDRADAAIASRRADA